jgi:FkbM family methyltransferase
MNRLARVLDRTPGIKRLIKRTLGAIKGELPIVEGELDLSEIPQLIGKPDCVVLEIGSNDGTHTNRFLDLMPQARIYCFEPDARAQQRFAHNVQSDRVKLYPIAIGASDGTAKFFASLGAPSNEWAERLPEGWDLSGSIRAPKEHKDVHPWCEFDASRTVQVRSLDSWAQEEGIGTVDFMWADVQGAEIDLINGGRHTLSRTRYFYTEYSDRELYEGQVDLKALLRVLPDFEVVRRYRDDVLLRNRLMH